jgi:hypothetical protein
LITGGTNVGKETTTMEGGEADDFLSPLLVQFLFFQ